MGYTICDIYNMDESGIFFGPRQINSFEGNECEGGKRLKEGITAMFCVNVDGEFEKILVTEKSGKPRCFKSIDTKALPVTW